MEEIQWPKLCIGCLKDETSTKLSYKKKIHIEGETIELIDRKKKFRVKIEEYFTSKTYLCSKCKKVGIKENFLRSGKIILIGLLFIILALFSPFLLPFLFVKGKDFKIIVIFLFFGGLVIFYGIMTLVSSSHEAFISWDFEFNISKEVKNVHDLTCIIKLSFKNNKFGKKLNKLNVPYPEKIQQKTCTLKDNKHNINLKTFIKVEKKDFKKKLL